MKSGREWPVLLLRIQESSEVEERDSWRAASRCSTLNPVETPIRLYPHPPVVWQAPSCRATATGCQDLGPQRYRNKATNLLRPRRPPRQVSALGFVLHRPPLSSRRSRRARKSFFPDPHLGREKEELGRVIPLARCQKGRGRVTRSIHSAPSPRRHTRRPPEKATQPGGRRASSPR